MVDLINKVRAKAVRKSVDTKSKKEEVVWYPDAALEQHVLKLIELGYISKTIEPIFVQQKDIVYDRLFNQYTEKMWSLKSKPSNPRIVIKKKEKDQDSKDMSCMFIVKFRSDGLKDFLPNSEDLSEDKTPLDVLIETLTSKLVGLSKENALKITDPDGGEFIIKNTVNLVASLDTMYYGDNPIHKSVATKLLTYLSTTASKSAKMFQGEFITEEEKTVVVESQTLHVKEGFLERACSYCHSEDELQALLKFVKISFYCQNFEFAIGDDVAERNERLGASIKGILL